MAGKFMDKLRMFWGIQEVEDDDYEDDDVVEEKYEPQGEEETLEAIHDKVRTIKTMKSSSTVYNIHTKKDMDVIIQTPESVDDCKVIADHLRCRKTVVMDISELDKAVGKRLFDFCLGVVYTLEGSMEEVRRGIFILAPNSVNVQGGQQEDYRTLQPWE